MWGWHAYFLVISPPFYSLPTCLLDRKRRQSFSNLIDLREWLIAFPPKIFFNFLSVLFINSLECVITLSLWKYLTGETDLMSKLVNRLLSFPYALYTFQRRHELDMMCTTCSCVCVYVSVRWYFISIWFVYITKCTSSNLKRVCTFPCGNEKIEQIFLLRISLIKVYRRNLLHTICLMHSMRTHTNSLTDKKNTIL